MEHSLWKPDRRLRLKAPRRIYILKKLFLMWLDIALSWFLSNRRLLCASVVNFSVQFHNTFKNILKPKISMLMMQLKEKPMPSSACLSLFKVSFVVDSICFGSVIMHGTEQRFPKILFRLTHTMTVPLVGLSRWRLRLKALELSLTANWILFVLVCKCSCICEIRLCPGCWKRVRFWQESWLQRLWILPKW